MPDNTTQRNVSLIQLSQFDQGVRHVLTFDELSLESGQILPNFSLAFEIFGDPNPNYSNIILVEHALTANSHASSYLDNPRILGSGWWDGIIGPDLPLDTNRYCVIGINALGGCDGSTGPSSLHPDGRPWGSRFPLITIRDQVHAEYRLTRYLGIDSFAAILGGSMGAARVLEWAIIYPDQVRSALVLAISARASAYMIGTQQLQIEAIQSDPHWHNGDYYTTGLQPIEGLRIARQIAHLTYRTAYEFDTRFENRAQTNIDPIMGGEFAVTSYLHHQADKLSRRFDAGSYVALTRSLNTHDIGRGRGGVIAALANCRIPCIVSGIDHDGLFPLSEQQFISKHLPNSSPLRIIHSHYGHDGFLLETTALSELITETLSLI